MESGARATRRWNGRLALVARLSVVLALAAGLLPPTGGPALLGAGAAPAGASGARWA